MTLRKIIVLQIVLILLIFSYAFFYKKTTFDTNTDAAINPNLKEQIQTLNQTVIQALNAKDTGKLYGYFAPDAQINKEKLESLIKQFEIYKALPIKNIQAHSDYHLTDINKSAKNVTVKSSEDNFKLTLADMPGGDLYVSLSEYPINNNTDFLLVFIYKKYGNNWDLLRIDTGPFKMGDKTADAWYNEALALHQKGYTLPALLRLGIAQHILRPFPFFEYTKEGDIKDKLLAFENEVKSKYAFPVTIEQVAGKPVVYFVHPDFREEGFVYQLDYVTKKSVGKNNRVAVEKEARDMHQLIDAVFAGVKETCDAVVYNAYEVPPLDRGKAVRKYETVVRVEE